MKKQELIDYLVRYDYVKSERVKNAFLKVERENFVLKEYKTRAYNDCPLPILAGQTISAPSMIAIMLEALELKWGQKVLEVGAGSGYNAALLCEIVGDENVFTIERIPELVDFAKENLKKSGYKAKVVLGDGTLGYQPEAPYDRIIVTAAAPKIPLPLISQTKIGGKIGIPIGSRHFYQDFIVATKTSQEKIEKKNLGGCAFVPLIGREGFGEGLL